MKTMFPLLHSISNSLSKWIIRNARKQKLKEKGISLWYIISVVFFLRSITHCNGHSLWIVCYDFSLFSSLFFSACFKMRIFDQLHHSSPSHWQKKASNLQLITPSKRKKRVQFQVAVSIRTTSVDTKRKKKPTRVTLCICVE